MHWQMTQKYTEVAGWWLVSSSLIKPPQIKGINYQFKIAIYRIELTWSCTNYKKCIALTLSPPNCLKPQILNKNMKL